jgi:hypothetical protein
MEGRWIHIGDAYEYYGRQMDTYALVCKWIHMQYRWKHLGNRWLHIRDGWILMEVRWIHIGDAYYYTMGVRWIHIVGKCRHMGYR